MKAQVRLDTGDVLDIEAEEGDLVQFNAADPNDVLHFPLQHRLEPRQPTDVYVRARHVVCIVFQDEDVKPNLEIRDGAMRQTQGGEQ